jgi:hypothetical protein
MSLIENIANALAADPQLAALTDAEVVAANSLSKSPRTQRITRATILDVFPDVSRALSFLGSLDAAAAQTQNAMLAAVCKTVVALIDGGGFDPANEKTEAIATVILAANLCTREEADLIIYQAQTYRFSGVVVEADVALARKLLTLRESQVEASAGWNRVMLLIDPVYESLRTGQDVTLPTIDQIRAAFDGA